AECAQVAADVDDDVSVAAFFELKKHGVDNPSLGDGAETDLYARFREAEFLAIELKLVVPDGFHCVAHFSVGRRGASLGGAFPQAFQRQPRDVERAAGGFGYF